MALLKGNLVDTRSWTQIGCCSVDTRKVHDFAENNFRNISSVHHCHDGLSHPFFTLLTKIVVHSMCIEIVTIEVCVTPFVTRIHGPSLLNKQ